MNKQHWRIEDQRVIDALQKNGFRVEHPELEIIPGAIHFITRKAEEDKDWYVTDCPITWNGQYTLSDGQIIKSSGTSLIIA